MRPVTRPGWIVIELQATVTAVGARHVHDGIDQIDGGLRLINHMQRDLPLAHTDPALVDALIQVLASEDVLVYRASMENTDSPHLGGIEQLTARITLGDPPVWYVIESFKWHSSSCVCHGATSTSVGSSAHVPLMIGSSDHEPPIIGSRLHLPKIPA